jgi:TP901-1 family phage major tail protein
MSAQAGKNFLLKVETPAGAGTYSTIGGLRTKSLTWNNAAIEVTNHGSNESRELLDGAGVHSMNVAGGGVHTGDAATLNKIEDAVRTGTMLNFQLVDASAGGRTYTGLFKVTSFVRSGEYSGEQTYTLALESSGAITVS